MSSDGGSPPEWARRAGITAEQWAALTPGEVVEATRAHMAGMQQGYAQGREQGREDGAWAGYLAGYDAGGEAAQHERPNAGEAEPGDDDQGK